MNNIQITKTQFNDTDVNAVNARDLHFELKVKKDFSDWIKQQLMIGRKNSVYVEGVDYLKNHLKGVRQIEYILSLDTAKRISLLSKTKKGNEVRKYFIEAEKQNSKQLMTPNQITEALALTAQSLTLQDERMDSQHERINQVEQYIEDDIKTRPISHAQQKALQDIKNKRVYQLGNDDKALISKLHSRIWSKFKKHFEIPRYSELPSMKFDDGVAFIRNITIADIV